MVSKIGAGIFVLSSLLGAGASVGAKEPGNPMKPYTDNPRVYIEERSPTNIGPSPFPFVDKSYDFVLPYLGTRECNCIPGEDFTSKDYFAFLKKAIDTSKRNGRSFVIDKCNYEITVYENGVASVTYPIELSQNICCNKRNEGDMRVPEGMRKIVRQGVGAFGRYFWLDYPNQTDRRRFKILKEGGYIPQNATIGGAIEIHEEGTGERPFVGEGGANWTLGCTALDEEDMTGLRSRLKPGDLGAIIGCIDPADFVK